jgi:Fe-S-cluster containining protein
VTRYGPIDLYARAETLGVDLDEALQGLIPLYVEVDARNQRNTQGLDLPCHRGCSECCHESVFLTPLEFYGAWLYLQESVDAETLDAVVRDGLAIFEANRALIESFNEPPPEGQEDHTQLHMQLRFRCPLLDGDGGCRVYPMREMLGRLFGCSFNEEGGVYGCHLVGAHLADQVVTLVRARPMAQRVHELPMTDRQQVYPWYIHELYG